MRVGEIAHGIAGATIIVNRRVSLARGMQAVAAGDD